MKGPGLFLKGKLGLKQQQVFLTAITRKDLKKKQQKNKKACFISQISVLERVFALGENLVKIIWL